MSNNAQLVVSTQSDNLEELLQVDPNEILDSPFGPEVNIPLSKSARKALEDSIAEEGKVRVPLFCIRNKSGQLQVICGTNRLAIAQKLKLEKVPVIIVAFETTEAARQFAIKDNAQRRQLSPNDMAYQGYLLWKSFETEKVKGITPRRRASEASGVSEGTLANFAYVIDSGFQDVIDNMISGELTVNAAYTKTKTLIDADDDPVTPVPVPAKLGRVEADLKTVADAIKTMGLLAGRVEALTKSVGDCGATEKKKRLKQFKRHMEVFRSAKGEGVIDNLLDALESVEIALL